MRKKMPYDAKVIRLVEAETERIYGQGGPLNKVDHNFLKE
jgi:hypothetical protein